VTKPNNARAVIIMMALDTPTVDGQMIVVPHIIAFFSAIVVARPVRPKCGDFFKRNAPAKPAPKPEIHVFPFLN
jgi:hypothetical protein